MCEAEIGKLNYLAAFPEVEEERQTTKHVVAATDSGYKHPLCCLQFVK